MSYVCNKLVSVIVPAYNHEKYVGDCLESIINQDYNNIEVIIGDDNSKDKTYEIIKNYEQRLLNRFNRVVINKNIVNLGITKNNNNLWSLARGDYYKFIASDDILMPSAISKLVEYFEMNQNADIVFSNMYVIDKNAHYKSLLNTKFAGLNKYYKKNPPVGKNLTSKLLENCFIGAPSVMISCKTKETYGFFLEEINFEDWEYWLRVSIDGYIAYLEEVTVCYRIINSSASHYADDKNGRNKFNDFVMSEFVVLDLYKNFVTSNILKRFYSDRIFTAYRINNKSFAKKLVNRMKSEKVYLSIKDKMRIFLVNNLVYRIYNKVKRKE